MGPRRLLRLLMLLGAALACASLTPAPPVRAADSEPGPVEIYERFRKDRNPKVRRKALRQLAGVRGKDVVRSLIDALEDEDLRLRDQAAAFLLAKHDRPEEIEALVKRGLSRRHEAVREVVARALAACGKAAREALIGILDDRHAAVRRVGVAALGELGDESLSPLVSERLDDSDGLVRAAACEALGALQGPRAAGAAAATLRGDRAFEGRVAGAQVLALAPSVANATHLSFGLKDRSWSVRLAAARALATYWSDADSARAAVGHLVVALEREERSRLRGAMADALRDLTGIDFGPEPARWKAWFDEVQERMELPGKRPRRRAARRGTTQSHLLDLPIESDHVCFVIDNSHSMNDPIRFGVKRTKQDTLLDAFERVVNRLPQGSRMNLIPFGTEPMPYKRALFPATRSSRRAAFRFLSKKVPDGRTNLYDALVLALADPSADTIVLVTDGAPSEGRYKTRRPILAGIARLNRYRGARIHTVEVGSKNTSSRWRGFMEQIARAAGGHYLAR